MQFEMARVAYFDASGSPDDSTAVSVGGLLSTPEKWLSFTKEWEGCLEAFGVSSLHMSQYAHSTGEFAAWKNDEPRRRRFLSGLMYAIEHHIEYTVAAAVWMTAYRRIDQTYRLSDFMKPYTLAACTCLSLLLNWAKNGGFAANELSYIFEKGDNDQSDLARCCTSLFASHNITPGFLKKTDIRLPSEIPAPIRQFEAADLIAYESRKANMIVEENSGSAFLDEIRKPALRLSQLPGGSDWMTFDSADLVKTCNEFGVPRRD